VITVIPTRSASSSSGTSSSPSSINVSTSIVEGHVEWRWQGLELRLLGARAELDDDKRRVMYYEMQQLVNQDGGVIVPMFASYVFATSNKVDHGGNFGSNWDMDGERWAERWSFA